MTIKVCIGSSCHLKGSYNIIKRLENLIDENNLKEKVELSAAFCLGHCTNGVTIQIDDEIITGTREDNIDKIFKTKVIDRL